MSRRARTTLACALLPLALAGLPAAAQQGLTLKPDHAHSAERSLRLGSVQLDLSVADLGAAQRARLFGDYYLTGPGFGDGQVSGGLRLTSGLSFGPRSSTLALPPGRTGDGLQLGPRMVAAAAGERDAERVTLPYVGLGYTSLSLREGWGFSADLGLGGLRPGERLRLGRSGPTAAQVENVLNDLRLAPVIQLGVSYSFW
ncbi:MAG: hypothetical protein KF683_04040 [Rubrivivax sp.]|nr:hypothetical protein [Rubrivivax sp.]